MQIERIVTMDILPMGELARRPFKTLPIRLDAVWNAAHIFGDKGGGGAQEKA